VKSDKWCEAGQVECELVGRDIVEDGHYLKACHAIKPHLIKISDMDQCLATYKQKKVVSKEEKAWEKFFKCREAIKELSNNRELKDLVKHEKEIFFKVIKEEGLE